MVVSSLTRSMTSRSPRSTSTRLGVKTMPLATTSTRTVLPETTASPLLTVAVARPTAPGSMPTPTLMASARAATPAINPVPVKAPGRSAFSAGSPASARRFSSTEARMPAVMSGRNEAMASSTSEDTVTRTQLGDGNNQSSKPALMTTMRAVAKRSNHAAPARTTRGPPPTTDGSR